MQVFVVVYWCVCMRLFTNCLNNRFCWWIYFFSASFNSFFYNSIETILRMLNILFFGPGHNDNSSIFQWIFFSLSRAFHFNYSVWNTRFLNNLLFFCRSFGTLNLIACNCWHFIFLSIDDSFSYFSFLFSIFFLSLLHVDIFVYMYIHY